MTYKIGQILTATEDMTLETAITGEKVTVRKGTKIIIGADNLAHHIRSGMIQPLGEGIEVEKYDSAGLAEYLVTTLKAHLPIEEMLEDYDIDESVLQDELSFALDEIGLC